MLTARLPPGRSVPRSQAQALPPVDVPKALQTFESLYPALLVAAHPILLPPVLAEAVLASDLAPVLARDERSAVLEPLLRLALSTKGERAVPVRDRKSVV